MIEIINTYITMVLYIISKQVSSESCVPFTNTKNYNILQELLFNRRFLSCGDVDFDQSRPICEVLYFLFFDFTFFKTRKDTYAYYKFNVVVNEEFYSTSQVALK